MILQNILNLIPSWGKVVGFNAQSSWENNYSLIDQCHIFSHNHKLCKKMYQFAAGAISSIANYKSGGVEDNAGRTRDH